MLSALILRLLRRVNLTRYPGDRDDDWEDPDDAEFELEDDACKEKGVAVGMHACWDVDNPFLLH